MNFKKYPYQDYNAFNLDWLISRMREISNDFDDFAAQNVLKYHDPIQWSITTAYEPNTIVRDGEDVYLSKKTVPAGISITNGDYWFKVGDISTYYVELQNIRHDIAAIDEGSNLIASQDIPANTLFWLNERLCFARSNIAEGDAFRLGENYRRETIYNALVRYENSNIARNTATNNRIDALDAVTNRRRRIICIGDSLSQGYRPEGNVTGWPELVRTRLGLTSGSSWYYAGRGGAGFTTAGQGANFLQLIQSLTITNPETITDVYVVGGANDSNSTSSQSTIRDAVIAFCNYCRTHFPRAVVHVGCIAYFAGAQQDANRLNICHGGYRQGCAGHGVMINGILGAMVGLSDFAADGIHVNQACEQRIAEAILSEVGPSRTIMGSGTGTGLITSNIPYPNAVINGDVLTFYKGRVSFCEVSGTLNANGTIYDIATLSECGIHGLSYNQNNTSNFHEMPWTGQVQKQDGSYVPAFGELYVLNRHLYLACWAVDSGGFINNIRSLNVGPTTGSLPIV